MSIDSAHSFAPNHRLAKQLEKEKTKANKQAKPKDDSKLQIQSMRATRKDRKYHRNVCYRIVYVKSGIWDAVNVAQDENEIYICVTRKGKKLREDA